MVLLIKFEQIFNLLRNLEVTVYQPELYNQFAQKADFDILISRFSKNTKKKNCR